MAENIRYIGDLRRVPVKEIDERGHRYLAMFDMDRFTDRLAGRLSGGMKQKLALACALVAQPKVLLLDEPTTGVDPVSRREFWDTLAHLAVDGLTIMVATPYLDEAERCHRVALMHLGEIRELGTPARVARDSWARSGSKFIRTIWARPKRFCCAKRCSIREIVDVQRFGDRLDVIAPDPVRGQQVVEEALHARQLTADVYPRSISRRWRIRLSRRCARIGQRQRRAARVSRQASAPAI